MFHQMIITNPIVNKSLGKWEYDYRNDALFLSDGAANIYYNESCEKKVFVEDFFGVLSAKSSQLLSSILSDTKSAEDVFFQQVCCADGQVKKVLVIMLKTSNIEGKRHGLSVDVTKIL